MLHPFKISRITRSLLGGIVWKMEAGQKRIHLTFDDGPVPEVTLWVVRQLEEYGAKATFFCVGHNIEKYPRIFDRIGGGGHTPANHTYHHLDGFKCPPETYLENVWKTEKYTGTRLFRPPYAHLTPEQYYTLKENFRIVLWDVISGDFYPKKSVETLRENLLANTGDGSIVLFHDSGKTSAKLTLLLPDFLRHFTDRGYEFCALPARNDQTEEILDPIPSLSGTF